MKGWIALSAGVALVAGAWLLVRPPELADEAPSQAGSVPEAKVAAPAAAPSRLGAASVLSIDLRGAARAVPPPKHTLFNEYLRAKNLRALYDRLKSSPEGQTPEGRYVLYDLLKRCATITDRTQRQPLVRTSDQRREDFVAAIPSNDPQRDKRIAAFDDISSNRCAGMDGVSIKQAELDKLLSDAASAGDPKAQALTIEQALWAERRANAPGGGWGRSNVSVSDAQVAALRSLAASGDPEAMVIAGRVMSSNWHDFQLQVDNQPADRAAMNQAWQLLACEYGYPCDTSNPRVQAGCAYQGHCDAQSLPDFIYYYGAAPNESQLMSQYQQVLRNAVTTGNWSQLTVGRGLPDPPSPGPRPGFGG